MAPDGDHDRIPLLPKYHVCIPGCCTEHWKQCRIGYTIGATIVGLLAGTMLSLSIFYGITAQQAAARSTKEIYMSANETYNITDGHQSYMLQKVCIRTERDNIDWTIMKGKCSVKDEPRIEDIIKLEGSIDEKKGYLFYLLRGSVFRIEGNMYARVYKANTNSEVPLLEQRCINESSDYMDDCICSNKRCHCHIGIEYNTHYYVCLLPDDPTILQYNISISVDVSHYNTSDYELCEELIDPSGESSVEMCCTLSLNIFQELSNPECLFLQSYTTDDSLLHRAVNVTLTAYGRDSVTGILAGATFVMVVSLLVLIFLCTIVGCRVKHRDKCNCVCSCFRII